MSDRRTPDLEVDRNVMATRTRTQRDPKREDLRRLGERIREQRRTKGMTQENLAQSLDLSVAYVSLIERGGRNPPYTTVLAIARALGVTPGRIVTED
jgi:ribosome-binding protein aMBF1 (putative translation factor)